MLYLANNKIGTITGTQKVVCGCGLLGEGGWCVLCPTTESNQPTKPITPPTPKIQSKTGLEGLTSLRLLDLGANRLRSMDGLQGLTSLQVGLCMCMYPPSNNRIGPFQHTTVHTYIGVHPPTTPSTSIHPSIHPSTTGALARQEQDRGRGGPLAPGADPPPPRHPEQPVGGYLHRFIHVMSIYR